MKQKFLKWIILLCVAAMAFTSFAACKKEPSESKGTQPTDTSDQPGTDADERTGNRPAQTDLSADVDGYYTYRMCVAYYPQYYVGDEKASGNGNAVDIAIYRRNEFLGDYFNIDVKIEIIGISEMASKLDTHVQAGSDFADVIFSIAGHIMPGAIPSGNVLDLNHANGLKLDASYWDQRIQKEYAINGKLFTLEGDFTIIDDLQTMVVLYNRAMYNDLGHLQKYGDAYDMVDRGDWTLDVMMEMFRNTSDVNSNPNMDKNSKWGMVSETIFPYELFLGSGSKNVINNDNGETVVLYADRSLSTQMFEKYDAIMKKLDASKEILYADNEAGKKILGENIWGEAANIFNSQRALFRTTTLHAAVGASKAKLNFGILPVPKFDTQQKEYYSLCSFQNHAPLLIPRTAMGHLDKTAAITEAMCYFSKYMDGNTVSIVDAFYEDMTYANICSSMEDYDMLMKVLANKTYDLDGALNITGNMWALMARAGGDISDLFSALNSNRTASLKKLDEYITDMNKNVIN